MSNEASRYAPELCRRRTWPYWGPGQVHGLPCAVTVTVAGAVDASTVSGLKVRSSSSVARASYTQLPTSGLLGRRRHTPIGAGAPVEGVHSALTVEVVVAGLAGEHIGGVAAKRCPRRRRPAACLLLLRRAACRLRSHRKACCWFRHR